MRYLLLALAGCPLAAAPSAQFVYGDGCPGESGAVPTLVATGLPIVDQTFDLVVTGPPNLPVLIAVGPDDFGNGIDINEPGFLGCSLEVNFTTTVPFGLPASGELTIPVTTWPVAGQSLYLQAVVLDAGPIVLGGLSEGLELTSLEAPPTIVITEILKDPDFSGDGTGEWIELYNTTDQPIDIEGWMLSDDDFDMAVLDAGGAGILVPALSYVTLGNSSDPALNGGLTHLATYTGFSLANSADEVVLSDADMNEVDRVDYLDSFQWPNLKGRSLSLQALLTHDLLNDNGENWEPGECYLAGVPYNLDRGTPGLANDQCLTEPPALPSGEILFTEIMQNPAQVPDSSGEWFELYNTTDAAIDLNGYSISFGVTEVISTSVVIGAGEYALFARSGASGSNGDLPTPDYVWTSLALGNGSVTAQVFDGAGAIVASISYDNGVTFPDPSGASMSLDPEFFDVAGAADGGNWCEGVSAYGDGDLGTPGMANDDCP